MTNTVSIRFAGFAVFLLMVLPSHALKKSDLSRTRREMIEIRAIDKGYSKNVSIQCTAEKNDPHVSIYYSSFERIRSIDVQYFDENKEKFRKLRGSDLGDFQAPSEVFYSSDRTREVGIPRGKPFRLNYETEVSDLMFLSHFNFYSPYVIDTFYYSVSIPEDLNLKYKVENPDVLIYFRMDSLRVKDRIIYSFTGVPDKKQEYKRKHSLRGESLLFRECQIKLIATPMKFKNNETTYFNDWITNKIEHVTDFDLKTTRVIDSLTKGILSKDSIVGALFEFVKSKIKYINIEIGYGAFIPNDVNSILTLHQGDCKDKANLLCQALIHKGIDARLAITSTTGAFTQVDFPCLGIANHMICAIKRPGSWQFLDPTEECGVPGKTGLMTQDRMAFIFGNDGGQFTRIPALKPEQNLARLDFSMEKHGDSLSGIFMISYKGKSMQEILEALNNYSSDEKLNIIKSYLALTTRNLNYSGIVTTTSPDSIFITGNVRMANHILTQSDSINFLSFDFLPRPMDFVNEDPLPGDILLSHTLAKKVNFKLIMKKPILHFNQKNYDYDKDGFAFQMSTSSKSNILNINYSFTYDRVEITRENSDQYQQFKALISNTFNNAVKFW